MRVDEEVSTQTCSPRSASRSSVTTRCCPGRTARAASPTRTTRHRAGLWPSSRTSSATRCSPATPTRTPSPRGPACRQRACVRTHAGSSATRWAATTRRSSSSPGRGCTGAIDKLVGILGLRVPSAFEDRWHVGALVPAEERPVVFIGPYEHHSNELAWRECIADVVVGPQGPRRPHQHLRHCCELLQRYSDRPLKIGSFSAASNVTGILTDTGCHLHDPPRARRPRRSGTSPPPRPTSTSRCTDPQRKTRTPRDSGPQAAYDSTRRALARKDAVFLSPHKFIGGPSTPGVLVVRRELWVTESPTSSAAGRCPTSTPTPTTTSPTRRTVRRAAPPRSSSPSAGAGVQLKEAVGVDVIRAREEDFLRRALAAWSREPTIEVLGNLEAERLSILSFVVHREGSTFLHHNFVVAVLNDLFGIQSRGGCSCAGPYGHQLLGIDSERSRAIERQTTLGCEGIKPGWVRLNLNYFISDTVFEYLLEAVRLVARDGWRLLGDYDFDVRTGRWAHKRGPVEPPLRLGQVGFERGRMTYPRHADRAPESALRATSWKGLASCERPHPRSRTRPASVRTSTTCGGSTCPGRPSGPESAQCVRPGDRRDLRA